MHFNPFSIKRILPIGALVAGALSITYFTQAQSTSTARPGSRPVPTPSGQLPPPPSWEKLKSAYNYTPERNLRVETRSVQDSEVFLQHIKFTNQKGQNVPGLFVRPKGRGTYPTVLLLHGLGSDKETMVKFFGRPLAERGIATLALDADQHGERRADSLPQGEIQRALAFGNVVKSGVLDYRQAMDYLKTRSDVDSTRIGALGYSMGSIMNSILGGVDERVKATLLYVGGDPIRPYLLSVPKLLRGVVETVSPSNYVGHISPRPVYFINGKQDVTIREDAARLLQSSARSPKTIHWAEAGHILPPEATGKGMDWLAGELKPR